MPFYSNKPPRNKKKEAEAHAEIFGIPERTMSTAPVSVLTAEEAERLREILLQHDKAHAANNSFDLHNPKVPTYKHKEFPMLVYKHETSKPSRDKLRNSGNGNEEMVHVPAKYDTLTVNDEKELKAALKKGYQQKPPDLAAQHQGIDPEEPLEPAEELEPEGEEAGN